MNGSVYYRIAADVVLGIHTSFVLFVIFGLVLILVGGVRGWPWIRNPWFRLGHVLAIGVVIAQAWLGAICPLTTLEMALRSRAGAAVYSGSFIAHWMEAILYYEAPLWVFAICYTAFGLLIVGSWIIFPPRRLVRRGQAARFPALETERLRLRSPRSGDAEGFAELLSDPTSYPYLSDSGPVPEKAVRSRIRAFRISFRSGKSVHWVLEARSNRAVIGYVAIHARRDVPSYLSYAVRKSFRRRGFAREALLAIGANLSTIGCQSLVARAHVDNTASRKLLLSLGCKELGSVSTPTGQRIEYRFKLN